MDYQNPNYLAPRVREGSSLVGELLPHDQSSPDISLSYQADLLKIMGERMDNLL